MKRAGGPLQKGKLDGYDCCEACWKCENCCQCLESKYSCSSSCSNDACQCKTCGYVSDGSNSNSREEEEDYAPSEDVSSLSMEEHKTEGAIFRSRMDQKPLFDNVHPSVLDSASSSSSSYEEIVDYIDPDDAIIQVLDELSGMKVGTMLQKSKRSKKVSGWTPFPTCKITQFRIRQNVSGDYYTVCYRKDGWKVDPLTELAVPSKRYKERMSAFFFDKWT